jgi:DNA-binding CsgD family transcriptional regulator
MPPVDDHPNRIPSPLREELGGLLATSLELLPVPIWVTGPDGVVCWRNTSAAAFLRSGAGAAGLEPATAPIRMGRDVVGTLWLVPPRRRSSNARPAPRLTRRQREVLELLALGRSTRDIASDLGIAEDTARNHIRLLLIELRVHTRLEAVVAAYRNDWL